ncbi:hypothetical protein L0222_02000 [bacterium]|nr:hypothetical protein [bacterium]MCI0605255.1 hypothetical protein [bacterium]
MCTEGSRAYLGRSAVCSRERTEESESDPDQAAEVSRDRWNAEPLISQSGNYNLAIKATDLAGNESTIQVSFIIDSVPPVIAVGASPEYSNVPITPSIEIIEENPVTITYKLDTYPYTPGTHISGEGQHILEVLLFDLWGR